MSEPPLEQRLSDEELGDLAEEVLTGRSRILDEEGMASDATFLLIFSFFDNQEKERLKRHGRVHPIGRGVGKGPSINGWPMSQSVHFLTFEEVEYIQEKVEEAKEALH